MEDRPIAIYRNRHEAEDRDGAEDDEERDREKTEVEIAGQADARHDGERHPKQPDLEETASGYSWK